MSVRLDECQAGSLETLQHQLIKKDSQLTESRLEALTSAHQLHTLRDTVASLRQEMARLKVENEKIYQNKGIPTGAATPEISPRKLYKTNTMKKQQAASVNNKELKNTFNIKYKMYSCATKFGDNNIFVFLKVKSRLGRKSSASVIAVETGRVALCYRSHAAWRVTLTRS